MQSATTIPAVQLSDADLYEHFRDKGLSHLDAVKHVERRRSAQPAEAPTAASGPTMLGAGISSMGQTATSGLADEILGNLIAAHGGSFAGNVPGQSYAQNRDAATTGLRQGVSEGAFTHPVPSLIGGAAGTLVNPLKYLLGPLTRGVGPAATAGTYGAVEGGALGAGAGTDPQSRAIGAGVGATVGGVFGTAVGYGAGKLAKPLGQMWRNLRGAFTRTEQAVVKTLGKSAAPETVQQVQEAAHRAFLRNEGFPPDAIEQLMTTWRAGGKLPTKPPTLPSAPIVRPGETIVAETPRFRNPQPIPGAPQGISVEGPPTPPNRGPSFREQYGIGAGGRQMPDVGKGKTLPYYPRGGSVEQSFGPTPSQSPPQLAPNQNAAFIEFLKGAHPGEIPGRVGTLRALGVIGPSEEAQLLQMLLGPTP